MRREVHDGVDLMLRQESRNQRVVADITDHQLARGYGLPKTLAQIVEDDDPLARLAELPHDMTADVAGAAGD